MSGIFISYRRIDQRGFAGRLTDSLGAIFGPDLVFRDIEDIRPGEDFVAVLERQLREVDVMLVMIGPDWLHASEDGVRRLDADDDFVRREIRTGLESDRPLLPVLVNGATMPTAEELPDDIRALARRQAIVLSDASWADDVARLAAQIKPLLATRQLRSKRPGRWWRCWAGAALAVPVIAIVVLQAGSWSPGGAGGAARNALTSPEQQSSAAARAFAGRWHAQVTYDWGASHDETFVFSVEETDVHGTASYLRLPRTVEDGRVQGDRLSFVTRSEEATGTGPAREVVHRYRGAITADELRLTLESSGGYGAHTPVDFVARRVAE